MNFNATIQWRKSAAGAGRRIVPRQPIIGWTVVGKVARKEFSEMTRDGRFRWAAGLALALLLASLLAGWLRYAETRKQHEAAGLAEREQGTLRQLLSLGARRRDLALGKALGATAPLLIVLLPPAVAGAIAVGLASGAYALFDNGSRLLLMAIGYLAYFGIFAGLTLTVSALATTSRQALLILLAFWFAGCLMAPPVVMDVARLWRPEPTALDFAAAIREDRLRVKAWYQRLAEVEARLLQRYGFDSRLPPACKK